MTMMGEGEEGPSSATPNTTAYNFGDVTFDGGFFFWGRGGRGNGFVQGIGGVTVFIN